jgi:hypothetical protein
MNINILIVNDAELETKYLNYKNQVENLINEINGNLLENFSSLDSVRLLKEKATEFDALLKKRYEKDIIEFSEDYYCKNIFDITTENLLMNGLYNKDEITKILSDNQKHISVEFYNFFTTLVKKVTKNEKILCWNL